MEKRSTNSEGLSLIRKGKMGLFHIVFSRVGLFAALLILQCGLLFSAFRWFENLLPHIWGGTVVFTVGMVLYLLNTRLDSTAKITWLIVIMLFPVFGLILFWFTQSEIGHRAVRARVAELGSQTRGLLHQDEGTLAALAEANPGAATLAHYANRNACHPVYQNTGVTFFPSGMEKWQDLLQALEGAEHFIFLEYFIVDEGLMWGKILEILARKAKAGVDVRVMYDGTCEFSTLPSDYPSRLEALGIRCKVFLPVVPFVSTHFNYRDHRKILVIDGRTAYTGGVNLADEYINHIEKFGEWKDVAIRLDGEAARSFTLMFLQMWSIDKAEPELERFLQAPAARPDGDCGFVMPYGDCPLDSDKVGERIYMDMLNRATRYVHIMTPYLILDGEMETALCFAAERGVDVRLILPGVPDKSAPYSLAKTHYAALLDAGVKIYEFTPGFVHAKVFVCDDREAVVGTINLDYRSLYHHFECAAWMYEAPCIAGIEQDYQRTLQRCRTVTRDTIWQGCKHLKWMGYALKTVAPLM
ncbi:MAG: cardiolipin synthase [Aristaeellaceae bacterium]